LTIAASRRIICTSNSAARDRRNEIQPVIATPHLSGRRAARSASTGKLCPMKVQENAETD
jgi:hypothetical protein